ncbi:MAG TPA: UDP-N-acetylmuramate dehydrogenase [Firmicutes bacterium]|nr:UDP-N-acetylmuramate dehydrogenase [Bacillota bacterium]
MNINSEVIENLTNIVGEKSILLDEPMSKHTTFRVGGAADIYLRPGSIAETVSLIGILKRMAVPYLIIGNGSNLLVSDKGIRGAVVEIGTGMEGYRVDDNILYAEAGIKLSKLANIALRNSLSGLEFASGIPGTLGGAVCMNAGAYDGEMRDVIREVTYYDDKGNINTISNERCEFDYRRSFFSGKSHVVLGCSLKLTKEDPEKIKSKMEDYNKRRKEKQPLEKPSAGSTFKRPAGYFAGKLIQDAGLRGYSIGGAAVSEKHSGFVINDGDATAKDIYELILYIKKTVKSKFDVELEPEVKLVGDFS